MSQVFLAGEKINLRPIEPEDAPSLLRADNHPEIRRALFRYLPKNLPRMKEFIDGLYQDQETVLLAICPKDDMAPVGYTGFFRCDWQSRAAVFFITLFDPADFGKGYGGQATRLVVKYGFETLNLNRIQLHVWTGNEAGIRAYEKAGFQVEGTLRQAMYRDGNYEDFHVMGLLRQEYFQSKR
jgi:RimJ/RimL family protein N-acetyltransferase